MDTKYYIHNYWDPQNERLQLAGFSKHVTFMAGSVRTGAAVLRTSRNPSNKSLKSSKPKEATHKRSALLGFRA